MHEMPEKYHGMCVNNADLGEEPEEPEEPEKPEEMETDCTED